MKCKNCGEKIIIDNSEGLEGEWIHKERDMYECKYPYRLIKFAEPEGD